MEEKTFSETERHLRGGAPTGDDSSEVEENPKKDWRKIFALSLVSIFLLSGTFYVGYWLGSQQSKVEAPEQTILTPTQALIPTPTPTYDPTADWKTYRDENVEFRHPAYLEQKPLQVFGSRSEQYFADKDTRYTLTFVVAGNYNQITGEPYLSLEERCQPCSNISKTIVDGVEAADFGNSIYFFSKDKKLVYEFDLTSKEDTETSGQLLRKILSTFKFLD